MKKKMVAWLAAAMIAPTALAQAPAPNKGYPVCEAMKRFEDGACASSAAGVDGQMMATENLDWKGAIRIGASPEALMGKKFPADQPWTLAPFVKNAKPDAQGRIKLSCDLFVARPDGALAAAQMGLPCHEGSRGPKDAWIALTGLKDAFAFDKKDPKGVWMAIMVIHDQHGDEAVLAWARVENLGAK